MTWTTRHWPTHFLEACVYSRLVRQVQLSTPHTLIIRVKQSVQAGGSQLCLLHTAHPRATCLELEVLAIKVKHVLERNTVGK